MKFIILIFLFINVIFAKVDIVVTYPYIADITKKIGNDKINVTTLAKGSRDPHFIIPKPSYISKIKRADLVIFNGGELEIGWLPPLISQANNANLKRVDLSTKIEFIEIPKSISRDKGDVHPDGNPHFHLNPFNILIIAKEIKNKLIEIDSQNSTTYQKNYEEFATKFKVKIDEWTKKLKALSGKNVYQYHSLFSYFLKQFNINSIANLEPLAGISPSSKHIKKLIDFSNEKEINLILQDVYHSPKVAKFLSSKTDIKMVILPHDVNAIDEVKDIFNLFDEIVNRLIND